jgi:hypothetical protein
MYVVKVREKGIEFIRCLAKWCKRTMQNEGRGHRAMVAVHGDGGKRHRHRRLEG